MRPARPLSARPTVRWVAIIVIIAALAAISLGAMRTHRGRDQANLAKVSTAELEAMVKRRPSVVLMSALFDRTRRSGQLEKALAIAQDLAKRYPGDARAHNVLGIAYASAGQADLAQQEFNAAIRMDPRGVDPYVNLGRLVQKMGDNNQARVEFDRATAVDPRSVSAWRGLGQACAALTQKDSAEEAFAKALALAPNDAETHTDLGTFQAEMGHGLDARPHLLKALSQGYRSGKLFAGLTMAFADQPQSPDDLQKALQYAAQAENLGDKGSLLLYAKGLALQRLHRYPEAIEVYHAAIASTPNANGPWIGISQCYRAVGLLKEAAQAASIGERILSTRQKTGNLERQIQSDPNRLDVREQYAALMMQNHQYFLAAEQYRYIAAHRPEEPRSWLRVANALELGGEREVAQYVRDYVAEELRPGGVAKGAPGTPPALH